MSLIRLGQFTLHSGATSDYKLEAGRFIEENIDGLVALVRRLVGPFGSVEGVPRGGLRLAEALAPFAGACGPPLLADDVCTTGRSLEERRGGRKAAGVVVFARGELPPWARAVFTVDPRLWLP